MALIKCKECGNEVSSSAKACPKCGAPTPKKTSLGTWIIGGVFAFIVFSCTSSMNSSSERRAQEAATVDPKVAAEKVRKDREINIVLAGAVHLRSRLKKPETFKLERAIMIDGKTICYEYSARNSWNDVKPEVYVITDAVSTSNAKEWNALCAGKAGEDYTAVRAVMPPL